MVGTGLAGPGCFGSALSGRVISWIRKVMENGFYWLLRLVKPNKMKELEKLLDKMSVII